ncbi:hypothetical protein C6P46_002582 [Rhodotorula mucilaginosa]|uniref:Xylanolytic transcriptional activator regulatory domain-containing protein n=1 Tax=Rhodotorula mucilaginosa TaxID=5537 RepID=A0A9P6W8D9_RHOMI|nr:hypothetical protein C6P46_002582 [Rhodotorula mucilaginosa]
MLPAQASPPVDAGIAASPRQLLARAGSSTGTNNPPSPASSLQKRSHTEATRHAHGTGSAKGKERRLDQDANEDGDSEDDGTVDPDGKPRRKRSRSVRQFVLNATESCRPAAIVKPANDAFLPPTIARSTDLEALTARLAHVEAYLKTLPPNFAMFRPLQPDAATAGKDGTPAAPEDGEKAINGGKKGQLGGDPDEGFSDTEDAALRVENGVFGNRALEGAGGPTGSLVAQRPPLRSAHSALVSSRPGHGGTVPRFGAPSTELTKALTSIVATPTVASASLRAHLLLDFDASAETVVRAKHDELERIMRTLPGREATVFLVERYFTNVSWLFHHLHAPSFRFEVEHFHSMCDQGRQREVDPFWLALLLMVLCLALDSMHYSRSPLSLRTEVNGQKDSTPVGKDTPLEAYTQEQLKALPERWFGASMRALKLAEFETVPRVRSIQTIVLYTQYLQLSSASRGQPSQLVVWLATAIRLAQVFGLHLLGSNPETMPPEDPAFPPGKNSLKREMSKRLWAVLVYQDWLGANSRNRCYTISPQHCDTDDPLNVNDSDLSPSTTDLVAAPSSVLTDSSADRIHIAMARQVRAVFDRVELARDWSYSTILDLDAGFRLILDDLPERWTLAADEQEQEAPMQRFQRHFVLEGLHNRIFRLHRPLLSKAHKNPKYKFSADACLKSARAVVVSTHNMREAVSDVPYTYSHVLGAALVLFNDLFQAIDHDLSAPEIDSKIATLQLAIEIFSSKPSSPSLAAVVQQGNRILAGLFREEERRRTNRAAKALVFAASGAENSTQVQEEDEEDQETFADILQRVARSLDTDAAPHRGTPPPTRNIPSKMATRPGAEVAATSSTGAPAYNLQQYGNAPLQPFDNSLPFPTSLSGTAGGLPYGTATTDALLAQPFTADLDWTFAHATAGPLTGSGGAFEYDLGLASFGLNLDNDIGLTPFNIDMTPQMDQQQQPQLATMSYNSTGVSGAPWADPMEAVDVGAFGGNLGAVRPGMSEADAAAAYWGNTGTGHMNV